MHGKGLLKAFDRVAPSQERELKYLWVTQGLPRQQSRSFTGA